MENERPLFKFYRSYWTVANELSDKDRLCFYDALIRKQFTGEEPKLKGMAHFAYISQKHNIDAQVKGFTDKTGVILTPIVPPIAPPAIQIELELKTEIKEEIKTCLNFDEFWDLYDKKVGKPNTLKLFEKTTEHERELIKNYIPKYKISKSEVKYRKDPERFLKNKVWEDEIITQNTSVPEPIKQKDMSGLHIIPDGQWKR